MGLASGFSRAASSLHAAFILLIATFILGSESVVAVDLETVLAGQVNLTTFRGLVKNHSDIFANLPEDVTVSPLTLTLLDSQLIDATRSSLPTTMLSGSSAIGKPTMRAWSKRL